MTFKVIVRRTGSKDSTRFYGTQQQMEEDLHNTVNTFQGGDKAIIEKEKGTDIF